MQMNMQNVLTMKIEIMKSKEWSDDDDDDQMQ